MRGSSWLTLFAAIAAFAATSSHDGLVDAFVTPRGRVRFFSPPTPSSQEQRQRPSSGSSSSSRHHLFDPASITEASSTFAPPSAMESMVASGSAAATSAVDSLLSSSNLMAFSDQGNNLAGIFFQASLLPYLLFLYFLQFRGNRLSELSNFGFQFVLIFVLSTIPSGIVSKSTYLTSLANVDWLHGGAELLLTLANVLIVLGLKESMTEERPPTSLATGRNIALGIAAIFVAFLVLGPGFGVQAHSPFLLGVGNLPADVVSQFPWVTHAEPENALSIPTWAIHFSSVFEYLFAMNLVWEFSKTTGNEKWKGMTWGMLPLHASGICACTYHFFYNPSSLQILVDMQAGFTLLGNITCMIAAYRIAASTGWSLDEVNPFPKSSTSPSGLVADGWAATPLAVDAAAVPDSKQVLALKLVAVTLVASYAMKYGELGLDLPFQPNTPAALAIVLGIPALTAYQFYSRGKAEGGEGALSFLPSFGGDGDDESALSFADVKKYGVAGTVAYIITEVAFWAVAFPVASYALYQSSGHWPDVLNDNTDRAAVLAFIFAGANIARAFVPIRLGAALALAPWVNENILGGKEGGDAIDIEVE